MNDQTGKEPDRYALLIGIDCYLPNELPGGGSYPSLGGCVRDVTHVEELLKIRLGMKDECILKLTSTDTGETEPPEPRERWPTYENIVAAFQKLVSIAQPGDQVYVHYSGHGGRTTTAYPDLKSENGVDETLVPNDIGNSEARYIRDVELAHLLKAMVEKGLIVTIVLDSCHSGGATRGYGGAVTRGIGLIDTTARPTKSLVASESELKETWKSFSGADTRSLKLGSGWILEADGYVLLAACRASESANEYAFDGLERSGALTYWLLNSLKDIRPDLTYKQLHEHIVAKVHSQFEQQTPQLQGEGNRVVFGCDRIEPQYAVNVMEVDLKNNRVLLNAGQTQGLRKGAQFVVYPTGLNDFSQVELRVALLEVVQLGATDSWTKVVKQFTNDRIDQGFQAVLLDPSTCRLRRTVRPVKQDTLPNSIDQDLALKLVVTRLAENNSGFVTMAKEGEPADFQVAVNSYSEYEIWDSAGKSIVNLYPYLRIDEENASAQVVKRLEHIVKFKNVQELDNHDIMSPLANKLLVELVGVQSDFDPVDKPEPQPFIDPGNTPTLNVGEWTFLRIRNNSAKVLNITVLDLQPDWGISQIYPGNAAFFEPLDPGQELPVPIPLQAYLPKGYVDGTDIIKVFATVGTTNFRWLELPSLGQPMKSAATRGGPANPLEELLRMVTIDGPKTRNLNPAAFPSWEWVSAQVELRVKK